MTTASAAWRSRGVRLLDRVSEREVFARLLKSARDGRGGALVVHGEPGVGKTALLAEALESADGFRVLRALGVEGEVELPFAALQQLLAPIMSLSGHLPGPQLDAISVAFGTRAGARRDPFLVGLAALGLLSEASRAQPIFVVVDDGQWLDRASGQALAFAARRLAADRVAIVVAIREPEHTFAGFPELHVAPLSGHDARALLASALVAPLDDEVLERLILESGGNPLALLELPRGLTPSQLAGGFGLPAAVTLDRGIEEGFARRLASLSSQSQLLLLVAAADATGDAGLVWRAAKTLGIEESAVVEAQSAGLITFDDGVTFRHPLVRSAAYRSARASERIAAHRALADATDPETDPDRRAWHRAQAAVLPDDDVAADLERSAARAQARGGLAAAAAFLERSAALTLNPDLRTARTLAAATRKQEAGALSEALLLLDRAASGRLDDRQRVHVDLLRARISFAIDRGREAPAHLLAAAKGLERHDVALARETYLDALSAAVFAGRLAGNLDARAVAERTRDAPPATTGPRAVDLLLDGLALLIVEGPVVGTPIVSQAVRAFRGGEIAASRGVPWLWLSGRAAGYIWDYEGWDSLTLHQIRIAREAGALGDLPLALSTRVGVEIFAGDLRAAEALEEQSRALADATDARIVPRYGPLALAAFRGRAADTASLVRASLEQFTARGEGLGISMANWVLAVLGNGLGNYRAAFDAAVEATVNPRELWFSTFAAVELIEAGARCGQTQRAAAALEVLESSTRASRTAWALGVEARSRALLSQGGAAESLYREAVETLEPTRLRFDVARTHLLFGEWLRRQGRRIDARSELRLAHGMFSDSGMEAFAERARIELEATGERARRRTIDNTGQLTPQEAEVARLAAIGHSNREIAGQLFISQSTVEYHLAKVFRKLDVTSRTQLARRVVAPPGTN